MKENEVENKPVEIADTPKYAIESLLKSDRFNIIHKELLEIILEKGKSYTLEETQKILNNELKKVVR